MLAFLTLARANWKLIAVGGAVVALLIAIAAFGAHERHVQKLADAAATAQAIAEAQAKNAAAIAVADAQRTKDVAATASLEKDLTHAYAATPDSKPSAARLALACARMRHQAGSGAKLPAACRSPG